MAIDTARSFITLKEARSHLGIPIDDVSGNVRLEAIINAVAKLMDSYTGRDLKERVHTDQYLTGDGTCTLALPSMPLDPSYTIACVIDSSREFTGTAEVFWNGNSSEDATLATLIVQDEEAAILRLVSGVFPSAPRSIKITYKAGYGSDDDYEFKEMALLLTSWYWNNEGLDQNLKSISMPGMNRSFSQDSMPPKVEAFLKAHRILL